MPDRRIDHSAPKRTGGEGLSGSPESGYSTVMAPGKPEPRGHLLGTKTFLLQPRPSDVCVGKISLPLWAMHRGGSQPSPSPETRQRSPRPSTQQVLKKSKHFQCSPNARHCPRGLQGTCATPQLPYEQYSHNPHLADVETEVQSGKITGLKSLT